MKTIEKIYQAFTGEKPIYRSAKRRDLEEGTSLTGEDFEHSEAIIGNQKIVLIWKGDRSRYELQIISPDEVLLRMPRDADGLRDSDIENLKSQFPDVDFGSLYPDFPKVYI